MSWEWVFPFNNTPWISLFHDLADVSQQVLGFAAAFGKLSWTLQGGPGCVWVPAGTSFTWHLLSPAPAWQGFTQDWKL